MLSPHSSAIQPCRKHFGSYTVVVRFLHLCICLLIIFSGTPVQAETRVSDISRPVDLAVAIPLSHTENLYQVTPDLYRSAQPSSKGMQSIAAYGIKSVINLRHYHTDTDEAQGTDLRLYHIPINTWSINDAQIIEALALIRSAPKPVLVHCMHGADRTGLVIAMYRIVEQGWSKQEALQELQNGGFGFHSMWKNIPKFLLNADIVSIKKRVDALASLRANRG